MEFPKWVEPHPEHIADDLRKLGFEVFMPRGGPRKALVTCAEEEVAVTAPPAR